MAKARLEVADVFRQYGEDYRIEHGSAVLPQQHRVMRAIERCRTAALGGHIDRCDCCDHEVISYNSCRNRHCPKCQALAKAKWLRARQAELLPVEYYHLVFTLPDPLQAVALQNPKALYDILFRAVSQTLLTIAADPKHLGAHIGFIAVLHTWGQTLSYHPHVHCIVPAGGLAPDALRWYRCRKGFFLPVRVLSRLFRRLFLQALQEAFDRGQLSFHGHLESLRSAPAFSDLLKRCRDTEWVVYSKAPLGGPQKVLDYLGRYTHRIAISNHRLLNMDRGKVSFSYRDYRDNNALKTMTLDAREFIRRFLLHVLPDGFVRIRYYGLLANRHRSEKLAKCRELLDAVPQPQAPLSQKQDWVQLFVSLTGKDPLLCPKCRRGRLLRIQTLPPTSALRGVPVRSPP